ncbi:MAG: PAS domain-containing sensor histidine kinase, partial [Lysobacteraceae bacterium]
MKRVEDALRSAMQRLENAQRVARLGDWTCDLATGAVTWSPQVYRMLGRDPAAGAPDLDEGVAMFENGAEATAAAFFDAQESGEPRAFELTANLDSGGRVDLHVIVVPDLGADGKVRGMRGTIQDITERKALEKHLFQAKEAADNANNAKTVFLATMSHEIRTHLNGMLGVLELIALAPANQEFRTALGEVRESGKSLQRIIDDILDFSKVEAGKLDIHLEPGNIVELVAGVHRIHAASAANQGLDMHYHVDPRISPAVMIDALRMRQILGNFVSNAIKFTPRGEVVLRGILLARDGRYERLRFEVEDTGIGIPLERQQRLFQPFEQAEADTASRFGGSGLGLSISRRLAELMRGEVGMSSAPGLGTTMWLELTVAVADVERSMRSLGKREAAPPLPGPTPVAPLAAAKPDARAPRVLVVDDHPVNRMV